MLRATRITHEDDTLVEPQPLPDAGHDEQLAETLRRLVTPAPPLPPPVERPGSERAIYGLD